MPPFRSLWALALAPACAPSTHQESQAPVCSTRIPGETALAPELADSGRIYRGTLSPDGRELWFFKKVTDDPEREDYRIAVTADGCALVFVRDFSSVHLVTLAAAAPPP